MKNKEILIRLLKDGHINEVEFQCLYDNVKEPESFDLQKSINDFDWGGMFRETWQEKDKTLPQIWHGVNHPITGQRLGPTY